MVQNRVHWRVIELPETNAPTAEQLSALLLKVDAQAVARVVSLGNSCVNWNILRLLAAAPLMKELDLRTVRIDSGKDGSVYAHPHHPELQAGLASIVRRLDTRTTHNQLPSLERVRLSRSNQKSDVAVELSQKLLVLRQDTTLSKQTTCGHCSCTIASASCTDRKEAMGALACFQCGLRSCFDLETECPLTRCCEACDEYYCSSCNLVTNQCTDCTALLCQTCFANCSVSCDQCGLQNCDD